MWGDDIPERDVEEPDVKPINAKCWTEYRICPKCKHMTLWYSKALRSARCGNEKCRYSISGDNAATVWADADPRHDEDEYEWHDQYD
jgi:hypothetical protein